MDRLPANIQLELAVREQPPILANLLELYAHDFSEFQPLDVGSDGRFGYKYLPLYWSELIDIRSSSDSMPCLQGSLW